MFYDVEPPSFSDLYKAGLFASFLAYIGIVFLVALSIAIGSRDINAFLGTMVVGGLFMTIPAIGLALFITAPLGCLVGYLLSKWMEPSHWLGAVTGGSIATGILAVWNIVTGITVWELLDPALVLFKVASIAICAGAGWFAQRRFLDWPPAFSDRDIEVFD